MSLILWSGASSNCLSDADDGQQSSSDTWGGPNISVIIENSTSRQRNAPMTQDNVPLPQIRTGLRAKLPRGLSHPVGAKAISRALHDCPMSDELWTSFGKRKLPIGSPVECAGFDCAFSVYSRTFPEGWILTVPAVPSDEKAFVRRFLISRGLPGVRDWLVRPRTKTWYVRFCSTVRRMGPSVRKRVVGSCLS
jgi:hypothetical protein